MNISSIMTISDVITIVIITFSSCWGLFYLWFKYQTNKYVTFKDFNLLQNLVLKIENENKTAFNTIDITLKNMEKTNQLKQDFILKELDHINSNIKNADRSYEIMNKFFERETQSNHK
jgi:hypothetical protein